MTVAFLAVVAVVVAVAAVAMVGLASAISAVALADFSVALHCFALDQTRFKLERKLERL